MMIVDFERTRFLAQLDTMMMQDRKGAIDDMLQVLREVGAIKQAYVTQMMDHQRLDREGYRDHCKRDAADHIGHLLLKDGVLQFKETNEKPYVTQLIATAFFVSPIK